MSIMYNTGSKIETLEGGREFSPVDNSRCIDHRAIIDAVLNCILYYHKMLRYQY